jgi:trehalose 6-phosphate phosphatase
LTLPLFEHLAEVAGEIGAARHLLLGLDFDGTLAPIVSRPKDAAMPEETRSLLQCLATRPDMTVAIVSGRALRDLARRMDSHVILAGNHGLEIGGRGLNFQHEQAERHRVMLHWMCGQLSRALSRIPGAWVEEKGLTASVHFRSAEESRKDEIALIVSGIAETDCDGFEVRKGNQVLEILPRVTWNKGSAVRWILEQLQGESTALCYLGDDVTDEDVFGTLDGITIRVGKHAPTAARFEVGDTDEVATFLRWLSATPFNGRHSVGAHDPLGSKAPSVNR